MKEYLRIVKKVLNEGELKDNRTGIKTKAIAGEMFQHNMQDGFPILTTKKVPFRLVASELEFFIRGITDKFWLQERNNHIWDEWATPKKASYGYSKEEKEKMLKERDLGPIYGFQWRHFNAKYDNFDSNYENKGIDQLKNLIEKIKTDPTDRRLIVSAWNPLQIKEMGLPPCHYSFQVTVIKNKLNLLWNQRSVDVMLGLPFNIASYGLLLHLIAKETKLEEGKLVGFLADTHIYENHINGAEEQLERDPQKYKLPKIKTNNFKSIFDWKYSDSELIDYNTYPKIKFDIAV